MSERTGPRDPSSNGDLARRILWTIPTPLAVLGTIDAAGRAHLMNISWITGAANAPWQLVASVETDSRTRANLQSTGVYALSLLRPDQRTLGRSFVKADLLVEQDPERVAGYEIARTASGAPALVDALAVLSGPASALRDLGDHELWLLGVVEVDAELSVLEGPASAHQTVSLGVHDTRMNYGG